MLSGVSAGIAGCSEAARCQAPTELAFDGAPVLDGDAVAPGLQADVHLTSSLSAGEQVDLAIIADDGTPLATMTAPADADGNVTFTAVSMPPPHVVLSATAKATCGIGRASLALDVTGTPACQLSLAPTPEASAYYSPIGVLSSVTDPDQTAPGYQATVQVATLPDWTAEIFEAPVADAPPGTSSLPAGVSLGMITAAANGVASQAVTVGDGAVGFSAVCRGPGAAQLTSPTTTVLADTTPPACAITAPADGATITPRYDVDPLAAGWQLPIAVHAGGDDVAGEPVVVAISAQDLTTSTVAMPAADATGASAGTATIPAAAGMWGLGLVMRDHAGNRCSTTQTYDVEPDGCDIELISPTAVSVDADRSQPGVQINMRIQVSAGCAGQAVSAVCGRDKPSTYPVNGIALLTETVCASEPCHAVTLCRFQVTNAAGITSYVPAAIAFDSPPSP